MRGPEDIMSQLEALPVEEVVRRLGVAVRRHMALCFMHDDHHQSLAFNTEKNTFYCFACQWGSGPIRMVQEHEERLFTEACIWLADQLDILLPVMQNNGTQAASLREESTNRNAPRAGSPRPKRKKSNQVNTPIK